MLGPFEESGHLRGYEVPFDGSLGKEEMGVKKSADKVGETLGVTCCK